MKKTNLLILVLFSIHAQASVWPTTNSWSAEMDQQYQQWLKTNTSERMFADKTLPSGQPNPYYGLRVDCADTVYSLRAIFSYENGLPFVINNPAGKDLPLITNEITRFDGTADSLKRFRQFLNWLYDLVSTKTMSLDTYSIPYKAIRGGSIILVSKTNHHSWTIKFVRSNGNPRLIYNSTAGAAAGYEIQERNAWPTPGFVFAPEEVHQIPGDITSPVISTKNIYKPGSYAGFRNWKPVNMMKTPEASIPGFSSEQHLVGQSKWATTATKTFQSVKESIDEAVLRLLTDACADYKQRVLAVIDAESFKKSNPACMNATDFETYSTPGRDRRLVEALVKARTFFKYGLNKYGPGSFLTDNLDMYNKLFPLISLSAQQEADQESSLNSSNFCSLSISSSVGALSLGEVKRRAFRAKLSSNPNDSYTGRFGFSKTSADNADQCPNYGLTSYRHDLKKMETDALSDLKQEYP